MGNITMELELSIGEVTIVGNGNATIACSLPNPSTLNLIVHDKQGRSVLNEIHQLEPDNPEIQFDTSSLKPGDYHAWIYIEDLVFVRPFHLVGEESSGSLLGKFFSRFR